jgi:Bifunctional DNA primase/polymerase, N-terminal
MTFLSEDGSTSNAVHWALYFASLGIRVAPAFEVDDGGQCGCLNPACRKPGKHPLFQEDWSIGSTDPTQIKSWWRRRPTASVLVQTGSRSKLLVIDADTRGNGIRSLNALQERFSELHESFLVRSGSGGLHIYLRTSIPWLSGTDLVCPGIDVRGQGGYVIGPVSLPTVHPVRPCQGSGSGSRPAATSASRSK